MAKKARHGTASAKCRPECKGVALTGTAMARRSKEKQRFGNAQTGIDRRGVARPGGTKHFRGIARSGGTEHRNGRTR